MSYKDFCEGCEREKSIFPCNARARGLENLDVLMSCRKMLIALSVTLHVCSITLPSSFQNFPRFEKKTPTFFGKSPTFFGKSPTFFAEHLEEIATFVVRISIARLCSP